MVGWSAIICASAVYVTSAAHFQAQPASATASIAAQASAPATPQRELLNKYCVTCHRGASAPAGLTLDSQDVSKPGERPEVWEKVVRKLRGGMMPPVGRPRPEAQTLDGFATWLETELDRASQDDVQKGRLNPGSVPIHRLNRAEYTNAVRDLLAVEVDAEALLPADDSSHGFDNLAGSLAVSPALLERYMSAARRVARLAVGDPTINPGFSSRRYTVSMNMYQNDRMSEELPFGSRGGLVIHHDFPLDGDYAIKVTLKRSVYEYIVNLEDSHQLDVRIDGQRLKRFTVGGENPGKPAPLSFSGTVIAAGGILPYPTQEWDDYRTSADTNLEVRVPVKAGRRAVAVTFLDKGWEKEGILQPPLREYSATVTELTDSGPRPEGPGVESVTIDGPYNVAGPGETPSRAKIFTCRPANASDGDESCAKKILSTLASRAYRRPVTENDVQQLVGFYREGKGAGGFDAGVQRSIERLLVDPEFLFRLERDPANVTAGAAYRLTDLELASRLSFFLWSSIPDDQLLDLAGHGKLKDPAVLEQQVRRMLADARSSALVENFFAQWLQLRQLRGSTPDPNFFPDFDENLRADFQRETGLFLEDQLRHDHSVMDLLSANYSFLNERLARFYGVGSVYGERFRRVTLPDDRRGGLLGQGSILTVTSYGNRTSPVLRAKWILDHILGTPPPPPPGNVPPFPAEKDAAGEPHSVRERLAQHRKNPVCAACHAPMDPLGFALENFDAIGQWRTIDAHAPIDASAVLVDGTKFTGPAELRNVLLARREQVVRTVTENLMTYAIGRGIEFYDEPSIRQIVRDAQSHEYRWSSIILGIVKSAPFEMRKSQDRGALRTADNSAPARR
jgi:mono/diheme cytochrome c family protein